LILRADSKRLQAMARARRAKDKAEWDRERLAAHAPAPDYVEVIKLAARLSPAAEEFYLLRASQAYLELGHYLDEYCAKRLTSAKEAAERATTVNANSVEAWKALGNALEDLVVYAGQLDKFPEAEKAFTKYKSLLTVKTAGHTNLGRLHVEWAERVKGKNGEEFRRHLDLAAEELNAVLRLEKDHARGLYFLGRQQQLKGDDRAAFVSFSKALAKRAEREGLWAKMQREAFPKSTTPLEMFHTLAEVYGVGQPDPKPEAGLGGFLYERAKGLYNDYFDTYKKPGTPDAEKQKAREWLQVSRELCDVGLKYAPKDKPLSDLRNLLAKHLE
jgi:hypothetical protein